MFTRSHLQEMKRRYASMYAPLIEEKFEEHCGVCGEQGIEDGTIEGANQYRKDTPGQEEVEVAESFELQATMALDDVGIKSKWKKGKLYVAKRDIKKAEKALGKSFKLKFLKTFLFLIKEGNFSAFDIFLKIKSMVSLIIFFISFRFLPFGSTKANLCISLILFIFKK